MKICNWDRSITNFLLIVLVSDNKRCTIYNTSKLLSLVEYITKGNYLPANVITGEVCYCVYISVSLMTIIDGRGFIVANKTKGHINTTKSQGICTINWCSFVKKAKYLTHFWKQGFVRLYNTRSSENESVIVQSWNEKSKDLYSLVKLWKNCLKDTKRIFYDLKGYLKNNTIWFAAFITTEIFNYMRESKKNNPLKSLSRRMSKTL